MTDLETQLRRGMDTYARRRPVARPPVDELLSRADDRGRVSAARPGRPRYLLTAAGLAAVAATVVGVAVWQGEPDRATTAAPPAGPALVALTCAPFAATDAPGASGEAAPPGPQIIVFVRRDMTDEQRAALTGALRADPRVTTYRYVDEAESAEEFRRLFRRNQAMLELIDQDPEILPTSYRLHLPPDAFDDAEVMAAELNGMAGVLRATTLSTCA